jgi:predicted CXXCH cytochrome family protein
MNRRLIIALLSLAIGLLLVTGAMAYTGSYTPGTGINSTVHDLNRTDTGMAYTQVTVPADTLARICIYCHAPHNTYKLDVANGGPGVGVGAGPDAGAAYDYLPLWNHDLSALTYTMYDNGPGAPNSGDHASQAKLLGMTPGSTSLLCLSCHDGSVAVNSWGNAAQRTHSTGTDLISTTYVIGKNGYLGNHHPIGFDYDGVQAGDTEIRSADVAMLTPTKFVRDFLYGGNRMECGTCHSVHNKGNAGEALLWRSDMNSELCLTCHNKGIYTAP